MNVGDKKIMPVKIKFSATEAWSLNSVHDRQIFHQYVSIVYLTTILNTLDYFGTYFTNFPFKYLRIERKNLQITKINNNNLKHIFRPEHSSTVNKSYVISRITDIYYCTNQSRSNFICISKYARHFQITAYNKYLTEGFVIFLPLRMKIA